MIDVAKQFADLMAERVEAYRRLMLAVWFPDGSCRHPHVDALGQCRFCAADVTTEAERV
jgi:hypothetical protein